MKDIPMPVIVFKGNGPSAVPHSGKNLAKKIIPTKRKKKLFKPTFFRVSLSFDIGFIELLRTWFFGCCRR